MMFYFLVNLKCKKAQLHADSIAERMKSLGREYEFLYSKKVGDLGEFAKDLESKGAKNIIVMGGDGSINEVLNGIESPENINLGIIPIGTGNDFAKSANIPKDPLKALQIILDNNIVSVDYMYTDTMRAINTISIGIDIEVLTRYNKKKKKSKSSYYRALIASLFKYRCISMQFQVDDTILELDRYFVAVAANGKYFGGNMMISPHSIINDGKIHFVAVKHFPFYKIPFALMGFIKGKHIKKKYTQEIVCDSVICSLNDYKNPENLQVVNYDGELRDKNKFEIKLKKGGCKMYLPMYNA